MNADTVLFAYQRFLGFRILSWGDDRILLGLEPGPGQRDHAGCVDRGVLASLLDAATGLAGCHCTVPGNMRRVVTLGLTAQFLAPAPRGAVWASGCIVHRDGKILVAEGLVRDAAGGAIATATARLRYIGGSERPEGHPESDVIVPDAAA